MPQELVFFIAQYGYLAIFILVFAQEIGIPNPIPNELLLMFSGYMSHRGDMNFIYVLLTVILADLIGTSILFFLFYWFGKVILHKIPRWFPISKSKLERLQIKYSHSGLGSIYIGRVTPFIRGYTAIIAGLIQINPITFIILALVTASIWALVGIGLGYVFYDYWEDILLGFSKYKTWLLIAISSVILYFILKKYLSKKEES